MKALIKEKQERVNPPYPCIKDNKASRTGDLPYVIVLFKGQGVGTILYSSNENYDYKYKTGFYSELLNESNFELFQGQITLSN